MAAVRHQAHLVVAHTFFIDHGIGADVHDFGGQSAVDGEIVGGELDGRHLAGMDEGDVYRRYFCVQHQRIVDGHDFHQIHARLNDAAQRLHLDLLHRAAHGGAHNRALNPVGIGLIALLQAAQLGGDVVEIAARFTGKGLHQGVGILLCFQVF